MTDIFIVSISLSECCEKNILSSATNLLYLPFLKISDALSKSNVYLSVNRAAFNVYSPTILLSTWLEQLAETLRKTTGPCQHHPTFWGQAGTYKVTNKDQCFVLPIAWCVSPSSFVQNVQHHTRDLIRTKEQGSL